MKRETTNAKRRAVSISPSSKNHMTATIRRGFALLIENGLTQGVIGRISYKIEVEGGAYKGVTARRESNDYGVMETKIDKYEFTASFAGKEANGVEVATDEQRAETDTLTVENAPDYTDKEILIIMHCYDKGHKVARLVSISMFSVPDYNAADGWECNMITEDEGKRVELIKRWIIERANDQHESILEFVKYEIVEAGTLSELDLNRQLKLEAEKHDCEERAVKVGDVVSSRTNVNSHGLRVETIETVKHVFDNALQLKEYFEQDCIMERSMNDAFKPFYNWKLNFHCPLWHYVEGEKLWLSYDDKSKAYLITSYSDEINKDDVMNRENEFRKFSLIARELGAKAFKEGKRCKSDLDDDFNAMLDQVKFKGFNLSDHYFFGWSDERAAFEARKKESLAADDTRKKNDEPKKVNAEVADEAMLDIQEPEVTESKPVDNSESEAKKLAIAAEIIGWQAFKDGKKCVPALDRNLDSLLENLPAGTGLAIMIYKRWARGWTDANLAAPVVYEEDSATDDSQAESEEIGQAKKPLTPESLMTIDNVDEALLEANGVWGGEFRGQWKYKILHSSARFFKSSDKWLAIGHAVAAYNSIPIADRVGTKEEAYNKINKARYDRLDAIWGLSSMDELSGMMQKSKALSGSLFSSALKGMDARPFSVARNRSVRDRLKVGYVGETIADLAFYMEERAKIEAMAE